jgi:hypothetical protein
MLYYLILALYGLIGYELSPALPAYLHCPAALLMIAFVAWSLSGQLPSLFLAEFCTNTAQILLNRSRSWRHFNTPK